MKLLITTQTIDKSDSNLGFFHGWILEFAQYFERIDVICLKKGTYEFPTHVHVYSLGKEVGESNLKYLARFYYFFSKVFFGIRVDYVFFHMGAIYNILAFPFFLIRKLFNTKFYWWKAHGHINWIGMIASRFVDCVYTASPESFLPQHKCKRIVGHGIDPAFSLTGKDKKQSPMNLLCNLRITRIKHIEIAIEVALLLIRENIDFQMKIVGQTVDKNYEKELQNLIVEYKLLDYVEFVGSVSHDAIISLYTKADVLVHPSETGSLDKAVLEAMYARVIPICLSGIYKELIPHELCVNENVPKLYCDIIKKIYSMEMGKIQEIQEQLWSVVEQQHSLKTLPMRIFNCHD